MRSERDGTCDIRWYWKRKRGCRTITREKDWWVFALGILFIISARLAGSTHLLQTRVPCGQA